MTPMEFSQYFDHTLLKPDMTLEDLQRLAEEWSTLGFSTICIPPLYVKNALRLVKGIKIATVIDFPLGYGGLNSKLALTAQALADGATEIDLVATVPHLKNKDYPAYGKEIREVKALLQNIPLKVIIETSLLCSDEIILASQLCQDNGADFVKTSTGFGIRGASLEDVALIQQGAPQCSIKASGGIRSLKDAMSFINAGVQRIGSSNSVGILKDFVASQSV